MKKILTLLFIAISILACKDSNGEVKTEESKKSSREWIPEPDANPVLTTAQVIAYKHRLDLWDRVSQISFTFNVDRPGKHFQRSWIWEPKTTNVTMIRSKDTISYLRNAMDSTHLAADQAFINDKYWLLAPFNLVWDEGTSFTEKQHQVAPISKDTLNVLTVVYGDQGGYTPGDAYDFYFNKDFMIREWVFRAKNDSLPSMTTTWEDYESFNGLQISKTHKDAKGELNLHFTNISVK